MIIKARHESLELKILRSLSNRLNLSAQEEQYYSSLKKGFEGELKFDTWLDGVSNRFLVLNDLLLEYNNTYFQIDSLLISTDTIYLFEVKNFEGDFFVEGERWYTVSKSEIKNPLLQLKRTESLLRRLLQDLGNNRSIEAHLIFMNPNFLLYQTPLNLPIIFPAQHKRFMNKLNSSQTILKGSDLKLAEKISLLHLHESPYTRLPKYTYEDLTKGITCLSCNSFNHSIINTTLVCSDCGKREDVDCAILRSIEEIKTLFPETKITTNTIHEWCKTISSKKTIRRILSSNFKLVGHGKTSYFTN